MTNKQNDPTALLADHGGKLYALLYRLTLRTDVAEDLLQELFCRLAVSQGFRQADNAVAFAYRSATNLAFDWRRARKRGPIAHPDSIAVEAGEPTPLAGLIRREQLEQTLTAIAELPTSSRDIVVLRYLEQQSYETIAEQFGKTAHQVRALAHKAMEELRKLLGAKSEHVKEPQRAEGK